MWVLLIFLFNEQRMKAAETHPFLPLRTARACVGIPARVWVLARDSVRATSISPHPMKGTVRAGHRSAASRVTRTTETVHRQASAAFSPGGVKCMDVDTPDHNKTWNSLLISSGVQIHGKTDRSNMGKRVRNHQYSHYQYKEIYPEKHLKNNGIKEGKPKFCHTAAHKSPRTSEKAMKRICSLTPVPGLVSAGL